MLGGFALAVLLAAVLLWWRDSLSTTHMAYALYLIGGVVAGGYVLVALGMNAGVGGPTVPQTTYWSLFPLADFAGGRRRADEMESGLGLVLVTVLILWSAGAIVELYLRLAGRFSNTFSA